MPVDKAIDHWRIATFTFAMVLLFQLKLLKVRVIASWTRIRFSWELVQQLDGQVGLPPGQRQEAEEEPQRPVGEQQTSLRLDLSAVISITSCWTKWSLFYIGSLWLSLLCYLFLLSGCSESKTAIIERQVKTTTCNLRTLLLIIFASHHQMNRVWRVVFFISRRDWVR